MTTPEEISPAAATAMLSSLQAAGAATRQGYSGAPIDLEAVTRRYIAQARQQDARRRWETDCPLEYRESDFEHPSLAPFRRQIDQVLAWRPGQKGILATGQTGRGKTRSMWALIRTLACEEALEVRYRHAVDWFSDLQQQINYGRDDAQRWVERVAQRPLVFLDDLGQEAVTTAKQEWAQSWLLRFLDIRIENGLPLLVTTNLTANNLAVPPLRWSISPA